MKSIGLQEIAEGEHGLMDYAMKQVREVPGIIFIWDAANKSSVISLESRAYILSIWVLLIRWGLPHVRDNCAPNRDATLRGTGMATPSAHSHIYNTREEIDVSVKG